MRSGAICVYDRIHGVGIGGLGVLGDRFDVLSLLEQLVTDILQLFASFHVKSNRACAWGRPGRRRRSRGAVGHGGREKKECGLIEWLGALF